MVVMGLLGISERLSGGESVPLCRRCAVVDVAVVAAVCCR